jgi:hypothetical protein
MRRRAIGSEFESSRQVDPSSLGLPLLGKSTSVLESITAMSIDLC